MLQTLPMIVQIMVKKFGLLFEPLTISDEPDIVIVDTWCEGHQGAPYLTGIQTNSYEVLKIIKYLKMRRLLGQMVLHPPC